MILEFKNETINGGSPEVKEQLLKYYKEKFAGINYLENHHGLGSAEIAAHETLLFSEGYLSKASVTTSLTQISLPLTARQVQTNYILAVLIHNTDSGVFMCSKESGDAYAPVLSVTYSDGTTVDYKVADDTYVRATGYKKANSNAKTAWGKENPNELWAMHSADVDNQMPYSDDEMRTYIKFDYAANGKDIERAAIKVYAQVKNPNGGTPASNLSLELMAFSPCFSNFTSDSLTWQSIFDTRSFAFYSWNGLGGIIYNEELYGRNFKKLGLTSQFVTATSRFYEEAALCAAGMYKEAKDMLLRFAEQTYETTKNATGTSGGYPNAHSIGAANRALVFPIVYKDLLDHDVLTAEENYEILRWLYQEINYVVYDKSGEMFVNGTAIPNMETKYYMDNFGPWHITAVYNCFAFFPEFKESPAWQKLFEEKLTLLADVLVNNDGSYVEVTFSYPSAVIGYYTEMMRYMSKQNYISNASETLKKNLSNIAQYLTDCAYPNGYLPKYGDCGRVLLEDDLSMLRNVNCIPNEPMKPRLTACYPDAKIVVSRTGTDESSAMLFMNAKGGGIHSHPDSLAILLYAEGRELLADKGHLTYDSNNEGYDLNSRTYTHNTVEVNSTAQRHPGCGGATVAAGHDGNARNIVQYANDSTTTIRAYTTSNVDAVHYRNVTWLKDFDLLLVNDHIKSTASESVSCTQNWHTSPNACPSVETDGTVLGYTNFKSGANLIIAQAAPNGDGNNVVIPSVKTSPDSNSHTKTSEYFEFAQAGKNVTFNTAIAYSKDSTLGMRAKNLNTGVKDYVASAMLVDRFYDTDCKNYKDSITYYNSFEDAPAERIVLSDENTFTTDAANACYRKGDKIDALSISGGTMLSVSSDNSTVARIKASAKVSDLSAKYDAATGIVIISTTDKDVVNGSITVTVEFSQYDSISGVTLNGKALTIGTDVTVSENAVTVKIQQ